MHLYFFDPCNLQKQWIRFAEIKDLFVTLTMQKIFLMFLFFFIGVASVFCKKQNNTPPTPIPIPPPATFEWKFEDNPIWTDEFDIAGVPDPSKWGYDVGGGGWGNNELQYYTNGLNSTVSNGTLKIVAKKDNSFGRDYTSSRMVTKNKVDWLYGRFEVKAKIPRGRGSWPAIWMLPTTSDYGNWPNSGEIDIMEHVGYEQNKVHITIHTKALNHLLGTQKSANKFVSTASDEFHIYRIDWAPYGIRGYIDGEKIFEFLNPGSGPDYWPFDKKFHLILNIAVGGDWGGAHGIDTTIFPIQMEVDHVKVYKFSK